MSGTFRLSRVAEDDDRRRGRDDQEYEVGRLLALSDGVFAIAMTLLVLDIPVPQLEHASDTSLQHALGALRPNVASFALSFLLVGMYWIGHRRLLRGLVRIDSWLVWLNLITLMLVCAVPFSSGLLSRYGNLATAVVLYAVNLSLLGLLVFGLRVQSWRGGLVAVVPSREQRRLLMLSSLLGIAVFTASIPIALYNPAAGEYTWLALPIASWALGLRRRSLDRP